MKTAALRLVTDDPPTIAKRTVGQAGRRANAEYRGREHLTEAEIDALVAAARKNRNGQRDALVIRMAFLHSLGASELVGLRWDQVFRQRHHVGDSAQGQPTVNAADPQ
jgi:integrase